MSRTIAEYIYSQCIAAGITSAGACALLGNIQKESGFRTNNLEDRANSLLNVTDEQYTKMVDDGTWTDFATDFGVRGGYGLIQVTLVSRKRLFLDFMHSRDRSIADLAGQVSFILWEMENMFPTVWRTVTSSNDLYDCTKIILDVYENPEEKTENLKVRYQYAKEWSDYFGNKGVSKSMTQNEAIQKVLNLARNEIGYHEQNDNITKYAAYLDSISGFYNGQKNGFAWCDVFVDYLFVKSFGTETGRLMICQPMQSAGAGCLYSAQYYKNEGRWFTSPQPGDQIFFSYKAGEYSHTGIVESVSNGKVNTIEGNTSDMVARRSYTVGSGSIVGYGRPKWELASGMKADETPVETTQPVEQSTSQKTTILRKGSKGIDVRVLQENLQKLGYDLGKYGADGDFGNDTYHAVKQFQKDYNVKPIDGEVGPITFAAIEEALKKKNKQDEPAVVVSQMLVQDAEPKASQQPSAVVVEQRGDTTVVKVPIEPAAVVVNNAQNLQPFQVGDTVNFIGTGHYLSPNAKIGFACKQGKAMIRAINTKANIKHPYYLAAVRGGGSTVRGWVNADAIQKI